MENKGTPIDNRKCSEFGKYYDMVWKAIDKHAEQRVQIISKKN